jgi:hypothetical protein
MRVRADVHAQPNVEHAGAELIHKAKRPDHGEAARRQRAPHFKGPQIVGDGQQHSFNRMGHGRSLLLVALFAGRFCFDGKGMDALAGQIAERTVHHALAFQSADAGKGRRLNLDAKMAFAGAVIAGMPAMLGTVIADDQAGWREAFGKAGGDFGFDGSVCHVFSFSKTDGMGKRCV